MSTRSKPDWYYEQSAAIPFRWRGDTIEVLLITTTKSKRWIFPKGIIEPELSPAESAAQEAFEEAGVKGKVYPDALGEYQYEKWGGVCRVEVFPLEVREEFDTWPESDVRDRKWLTIPETHELLDEPGLEILLTDLPQSVTR